MSNQSGRKTTDAHVLQFAGTLRRRGGAYLRNTAASPLPWLLLLLVAAACARPPSAAMRASLAHTLWLAFVYWASMLAGAAPFIVCGGLAAALALRLSRRVTPIGRGLAPIAALLCGACDCTLFGYAPALRDAPRWLSSFALTLAACCGPVALVATWRTMGVRMLVLRGAAGLLAAVLSAVFVCRDRSKDTAAPGRRRCAHAQHDARLFSLAASLAHGFTSFSCAAALGSLLLAFAAGALAHTGPLAAAIAGALISPCSTADALLARSFFRPASDQIAFIIAGQCLDWRQLTLMYRTFGLRTMLGSAGGALIALVSASAMASAQRW